MELNMHKKWLTISKTISDCKKWKIWQILCLQAVNLAPKWTAGVRHGTSLVVRRVWSGRIIVVLFWTKYAFPRQIKPGIFKLTTCRGHSNLLTVFSFVNCEEKGLLSCRFGRAPNFWQPLELRAQLPYARIRPRNINPSFLVPLWWWRVCWLTSF